MENMTYEVALVYWKLASLRGDKEKFRTKSKEINWHFAILISIILIVTVAVRAIKYSILISYAR
jgi:hypothetical protein